MKKMRYLLLVGILLLGVYIFNVCAEKVVIKTELLNIQPKFMKNSDGTIGGMCIEIMKLIEKNSNFQFSYLSELVPIQRIDENLANNIVDAHFGLGKTPERLKVLDFGEPLFKIKYIAIVRTDDKITVSSIDELTKLAVSETILSVGGTATNDYVTRQLNLTVDNSSNSLEGNLLKLVNGRGRMMIYTDLSLVYEMNNNPKFIGKFKVLPLPIYASEQWLAFAKNVPEQTQTKLVEIIKQLKTSGEWDKVLDKYLKTK